jgi:hypothetical protein
MRRRVPEAIAAVVVAAGLHACADENPVCGGSDARHYDEGLIFHLEKAHVPYRKMDRGGLCVEEKYGRQFRQAERELEKYFPQIAHNPKDSCEEKALVEWATREKLRFDVRPTVDAAGRPSGNNLFLLRAYTAEEMATYREKLDKSAPIGMTCRRVS